MLIGVRLPGKVELAKPGGKRFGVCPCRSLFHAIRESDTDDFFPIWIGDNKVVGRGIKTWDCVGSWSVQFDEKVRRTWLRGLHMFAHGCGGCQRSCVL